MRVAYVLLFLVIFSGCLKPEIKPYPETPAASRANAQAFLAQPDLAWFPGVRFDSHVPLTKNFYAFVGSSYGPKAFDVQVTPVRRWDLETTDEALRKMESMAADIPTKVIPKLVQRDKEPFWSLSETGPFRLEIRLLDLRLTSPMKEYLKHLVLRGLPGDQALLDLKLVEKATGRIVAAAHTYTVPGLDQERSITEAIQRFLDMTEARIKRRCGTAPT